MSKLSQFTIVCAVSLCIVSSSRAENACTIIEIDLLNATSGWASDLNNHAQVVGTLSYTGDEPSLQAFVWRAGHTRTLPTLEAGGNAGANGINDFGWIVGTASREGYGAAPVVWTLRGIRQLQAEIPAVAEDINGLGQIIGNGFRVIDNVAVGACLFWESPESNAVDLGSLGGNGCQVTAINDRGEVVGSSWTAEQERHGFVWKDGAMIDIGSPPDAPTDGVVDQALLDINNTGLAVGSSNTRQGTYPMVWSSQRGPRVLPFKASSASVNEWGTIAAVLYQADSHLLLADRDGRFRDKGSLGGFVDGLSFNERFQIAWNISVEVTKAYFCQLR